MFYYCMPLIRFLCLKEQCLLYKLESKFRRDNDWKYNLELALKNSTNSGRVRLMTSHILPKENNFELKPIGFSVLSARTLTAYHRGRKPISVIEHYQQRHNITLEDSKFLPCLIVTRQGTQAQYFPLETVKICFLEPNDYKCWSIDYWCAPPLPGDWETRFPPKVLRLSPASDINGDGTPQSQTGECTCTNEGVTVIKNDSSDVMIYVKNAAKVKTVKLKF